MARKMKNKFKIKHQPIPKMKQIEEPARRIPVRAEVDVLVVGAGPAGLMAAQAAALEKGTKVMLVESRGFLGGNLTIGLPVLGFLGHKGTQIIKGLPQNFIDRLRARGAASEHRPCKNHMSLTIIDEEEVKRTALEIMEEKGVEVLLYVFCTDVVKEGDDVKGVIIESKAGREAILARTVIDCTGDGDVAFRAGVDLANLEFMQFHPTALYEERSNRRPLITEAMRGEGARLLDEKGRPFMLRHDKRGDLAPRDVVAQAMMEEMLHSGAPCLFLDVSGVKQDLPTRFPTVFGQCREAGLDIRKEPIPVVPAAHYFCGGVLTDTRGRTSMRGLYAIGECACTGLHGANRLASTSLLEALVWGVSCGKDLARRAASGGMPTGLAAAIPDWQHEGDERHDDPALVAQDWANIRNTMWNYVGISRTASPSTRASRLSAYIMRLARRMSCGSMGRRASPMVGLG